jgi:hypothetical protein
LAAVTAGTKIGGSITAFVAGSGVKSVAEEIGKAKGIEKVIYVENGAYDKVRMYAGLRRVQDLTCGCRVCLRTMRHSWLRT